MSILEKFRIATWEKQGGHKKMIYVNNFNPTWSHNEKTYLSAAIKRKAKILITQLRTESHHLRYKTSRWVVPKEEWEERTCVFCEEGVVETEWPIRAFAA